MSPLESFNPPQKERAKNALEKNKIGNLARALALGVALGAGSASGQEVNEENNLESGSVISTEFRKETEDDWVKLAEEYPDQALSRLKEIIKAPFVEKVAGIVFDKDPQLALSGYDDYKELQNSKKFLEGAVKKLLSNERVQFYVDKLSANADESDDQLVRDIQAISQKEKTTAHLILAHPEVVKNLENSDIYFKESAEKSPAFMVMAFADNIFANLPKTIAESITHRACLDVINSEYPYLVLASSEIIQKYLPGAPSILGQAVDRSLENKQFWVFIDRTEFLEALSETERLRVVEHILRADPLLVYMNYQPKFKESAEKETLFTKVLETSTSPEAIILKQIREADIDDEEKIYLPVILDEFVYNKRFTIEEGAKIVRNKELILKLIGEITKRKNYIGKESIKKFLSEPVTNDITPKSENS